MKRAAPGGDGRARPETTLEPILVALERVTGFRPVPSGDEYRACCPVHEADGRSHTPSLSVRAGDRQSVRGFLIGPSGPIRLFPRASANMRLTNRKFAAHPPGLWRT